MWLQRKLRGAAPLCKQYAQYGTSSLPLCARPAVNNYHNKNDIRQPRVDLVSKGGWCTPSAVAAKGSGLDPSTSGSSEAVAPAGWSAADVDAAWNAVSRALLKLGKGGAQDSHFRSLQELLQSHNLVKVQINGDASAARSIAEQLAQGCSAHLLAVRSSTILLGHGGLAKAALLSVAKESLDKMKRYHEKRMNRGQPQGQPMQPQPDLREDSRPASTARPPAREPAGSRSGSAPPAAAGPRQPRGPSIDRMINAAVTKGPVTKDSLRQEWSSLAASIHEVEVQEEQADKQKRPGRGRAGAAGGPRGQDRSTAGDRRSFSIRRGSGAARSEGGSGAAGGRRGLGGSRRVLFEREEEDE
mmetsp:Transcript_33714/g.74637  ORF Transcript_33714/g.74637 Transcript_33714/m.74637 type:complete len:357 (-) Transcript_33714:2027-3097(-)|eukprot:CAMPEP_0202895162 /NCGR_PEP_ID=MMETSP1392-20130828/4415_1 /ASSEMBLY_ACC=CAM_ASM_000868 /TAXON_ID=225041 /ORGANISM="Chlamydomonas chlamydogama, Strain SAG 11-48b" /LENGTH=356 /DNA_ID=CAMNT_0049580077 /DNA_START=61 /DNA_END=1131 /DNA_ORIENTATION=-